ncbi:hypothetical protein [Pseudomonas oryzihabitans]|uniref:Uncharacterized protein n=1 Tax=Pseudomonas oryzihabitans TaxID=47885 RepID=A0AAJ2EXX5_9PSED|nr:hypothetical protein [Pseudomonas psychrotolerans]MDR6236277.1 hypothetical protein [Pseudomonas psychrotolerans]MDR6354374.1 hypothetical protein [Pseudomonas psychrotolerans]
MSTPLSADAASKILVDAFQPLGCVVSSGADGHDLALGIADAQGKTLYTEEQLSEADYGDPLRLAGYIGTIRAELEGRGQRLDDWQMPFITDPDALPPPAVN